MVMARITINVCDVCEAQEGVRQYEIKQGTRKAKVDLCEGHRQNIEGLMTEYEKRSKPAARATTARGGRRSSRVATMEEIEASKSK